MVIGVRGSDAAARGPVGLSVPCTWRDGSDCRNWRRLRCQGVRGAGVRASREVVVYVPARELWGTDVAASTVGCPDAASTTRRVDASRRCSAVLGRLRVVDDRRSRQCTASRRVLRSRPLTTTGPDPHWQTRGCVTTPRRRVFDVSTPCAVNGALDSAAVTRATLSQPATAARGTKFRTLEDVSRAACCCISVHLR